MKRSSQPASGAVSVPLEFAGDHVIWATWLYFAEQKTQNEVARELGVSRASIANYLSEARERGLVSIAIAPDLLGNIELGRTLGARYDLANAHIVPTPAGKPNFEQVLRERLGIAAAHVLSSILAPDSIIGISSGRTVLALGEALAVGNFPDVKVVQVAGSSVSGANYSPEYCTALIAGKLGARSINLYAPAIISNTKLCEEILSEPSLVNQFELIRSLDTLVYGVSELDPDTKFSDSVFVTKNVIEQYLKQNAIGAVLGRFVDRNGKETHGPLAGRIIGMQVRAMKNVPRRILVAGGQKKLEIIQTMLDAGFVTHLVTDMKTAEKLA